MNEEPTEDDIREFEELKSGMAEDYYAAIGKAISSWSDTEGSLVIVAAMLLDTTQEKAGLIFYSINNFHSWLSIIDELFAIEPRYRSLRSDWTPIAERLKKLNDTRVRLAHHALDSGKGIEALMAGEDLEVTFPSLRPNQYDTRTKTKKQTPLQFEQVATFIEELASVTVRLAGLIERAAPIYLEPKRRLVAKVQDLQRKAGEKVTEPKHPRPELS